MKDFFKPEVWHNNEAYCNSNDGWGMCNTGWWKEHRTHRFVICSLGGIGCNVDHAFIKASNLEKRLNETI